MWAWINDAATLVAQYPGWTLVAAFLAAIIEALAVVGTIVPGTFILMGLAGAAAAAGHPLLPILAISILGAVVGDYLSYWLGFHYRVTVRGWWILSQRPGLMESADRFFARYGAYSVALCRFVPVLRSTVPLVAGIAGINPDGSNGRARIASKSCDAAVVAPQGSRSSTVCACACIASLAAPD